MQSILTEEVDSVISSPCNRTQRKPTSLIQRYDMKQMTSKTKQSKMKRKTSIENASHSTTKNTYNHSVKEIGAFEDCGLEAVERLAIV